MPFPTEVCLDSTSICPQTETGEEFAEPNAIHLELNISAVSKKKEVTKVLEVPSRISNLGTVRKLTELSNRIYQNYTKHYD